MMYSSARIGGPKPTAKFLDGLYQQFVETGLSGPHSRFGHTLARLLNRVWAEGKPFQLTFDGTGYTLRCNPTPPPALSPSECDEAEAGRIHGAKS